MQFLTGRLFLMPKLMVLLAVFLISNASASGLPAAHDLQAEYQAQGQNQNGQSKVILMLVSQPNCSYCVQITEEILQPMIISGQYGSTTLFSELEINTGATIKDLDGREIGATEFARRYDAWATPTLLFLDQQGNQVAKKMVGINTPELYGFYVDKALREGFATLNP